MAAIHPISITPADLPLASLWRWEAERGTQVFMTQPVGGGAVQTLTWGQAADEVRRMAAWLQAQPWPAGSRVAILGKNSAHWMLADLAIWAAGHVSVPVYPTLGAQALSHVLVHSEARACFVGKLDSTQALHEGLPAGLPLIALPLAPPLPGALDWTTLCAAQAPLGGQPTRQPDELATLIYTSGTTGEPKGVMHSFGAMTWALECALQRRPLQPEERFLSYLPLAHIAERMLIEQGGLRSGGQIFFAESLDTFMADLQRARPTIFLSVPRLWLKFQQGVSDKLPPATLARLLRVPLLGRLVARKVLAGLGLDRCHIAITGAAPMPAECLGWWRKLALDLVEVYGLTETCGLTHGTPPGSFMPGTVGTVYAGVQSRIDADTGEIQVRSPALMLGYFKQPEATAQAMTTDGWLRTGDQGRVEPDGSLRITGRLADTFKTSKGQFIAPAVIEAPLAGHPDVEACMVTGWGLDQPLGLVLLSPAAAQRASAPDQRATLLQSLGEHLFALNAKLNRHEQLCCLAVLSTPWTPDSGLVTPTLKIRRAQVDATFSDRYRAWADGPDAVVWAESDAAIDIPFQMAAE